MSMRAFVSSVLALTGLACGLQAAAATRLNTAAEKDLAAISALTGARPEVIGVLPDGRPSAVVGDLSPASRGPAEAVARAFALGHPALFGVPVESLELVKIITVDGIRAVRFSQTHEGVPVVGADAVVLVRGDGVVRALSSNLVDLGGLDVQPAVSDLDAAIAALENAPWFIPWDLEGFFGRLVVLSFPGAGRLAWELHFGQVPALLSNIWAYVDAKTGDVIRYDNRILFAYRGLVFETNPGPADDRNVPIEVDLRVPDGGMEYDTDDYDTDLVAAIKTACDYDAGAADCPGEGAIWLRHPKFMARNCPDYHELMEIDLSDLGVPININAHMCSEVQTAHADAEGHFSFDDWKGADGGLVDYYDEAVPETAMALSDKFAEVQMFYHVGKVYGFFEDLMDDHPQAGDYDWQGHAIKPLMATVNYKTPIDIANLGGILGQIPGAINKNGPLYPLDNAMFMAGSDTTSIPGISRTYDSIVFGQGSKSDFGWDGDVIYHEFTHSVDNSVTHGGTSMFSGFGDEWGVNIEPGGMSEGYADAFPGFITNEPTMGEYSLAALSSSSVRDMSGHDVCPDHMKGLVWDDSWSWSQSLYQARDAVVAALAGTVAEDEAKHKFHQAAFIGLSSIVANQGFAEPAAVTLTAAEDLLGADARAAAAQVFAAHHTDDCPRVADDNGTGTSGRDNPIVIPATVSGVRGRPHTPGVVQYKVTVKDGDPAINFTALVTTSMSTMGIPTTGVAKVNVLVRHDNPIQFTYDFGAAAPEPNVLVDTDVMGPYPPEKKGTVANGQEVFFSMTGEGGGALPAGAYYLMPVNAGTGIADLNNAEAKVGDPVADEDGTYEYGEAPPASDADADTDTDTDTDADAGDADGGDADSDADTDTDTDADTGDAGADAAVESDSDSGCGCAVPGSAARANLSPVIRLLAACASALLHR